MSTDHFSSEKACVDSVVRLLTPPDSHIASIYCDGMPEMSRLCGGSCCYTAPPSVLPPAQRLVYQGCAQSRGQSATSKVETYRSRAWKNKVKLRRKAHLGSTNGAL